MPRRFIVTNPTIFVLYLQRVKNSAKFLIFCANRFDRAYRSHSLCRMSNPKLFTNLVPKQLLFAQQQVLELVARDAPIAESLTAICKFSEISMPSMMASILVFDEPTQVLRKGGYGRLPSTFQDAIDGMEPGPVTGSCGTAAYRKDRVICEDVRIDPLWTPFREFAVQYGIQSAWSTPILSAKGKLIGVFGMYYGDCRKPSVDDLSLVDHFVHLAAIAIERHRVDADREHLSTHDQLTGLGNRQLLNNAVARWSNDPSTPPLTVALLDIDHFKLHNEYLGRSIADMLLKETATRIGKLATGNDLVVRLGGDQFILITPKQGDSMNEQFQKVISVFKQPIDVADTRIRLSVSAGIVHWDPQATEFDDAFHQVQQACLAAKERGGDRWIAYGPDERKLADERRRVARILTDAIVNQRVTIYLQPIVELATGRPIGFESLARLVGSTAEAIAPSVFIPIAEESSLIDALGLSVLRSTCKVLSDMNGPLGGMTANINVSMRQLMRDGFAVSAAKIASELGVSTNRICIEVTESQWLDAEGPALTSLYELKEHGFRLALDDFGTGYASLKTLQQFPFHHLKIDRSFTSRLNDGDRGVALFDAALQMATACGMSATAEGIETPEQAEQLRAMSCRYGQGYFWARPAPAELAVKWIQDQLAAPVC